MKALLSTMGWVDIVQLDEKLYHFLVRLFYANMSRKSAIEITKMVNKKNFTLTPTIINNALGIHDNAMGDCSLNRFSDLEAIQKAFNRDDYTTRTKLSVANLSFDGRILHWILTHILEPKSGSYADIDARDCKCLAYILSGHRINLGSLILKYMHKPTVRCNSPLVYGTFLTRIFKHFRVKLDTEKEESLDPKDILDKNTCGRMKWSASSGVWTKVGKEAEEAPSEGRRGINQELLTHIQELNMLFRTFKEETCEKIDGVVTRMNRIECKVDHLYQHTFPDDASGPSEII